MTPGISEDATGYHNYQVLLASVTPGTVQWQAVISPRVSLVSRLRSPRLNPHAGGECQILTMEKMTKAKKTQKRRKQFLRNEEAV